VKTYKTVSTIKLPNFGSAFFRTILLDFQHDYKYKEKDSATAECKTYTTTCLTELLKALGRKLQSVLHIKKMGEVGKTG
jgi:hypothetical protein